MATGTTATKTEAEKSAGLQPTPTPPNVGQNQEDVIETPTLTIHELAYYKWEEAGCPEGDGQEFWYAAERELTEQQ
jgi:hypothetical protein